jgi:dimethylargininase
MGSKKALVRRVSPRLAEGVVTNIERQPVDVHLAAKQWNGYVEALEDHDWEVVEVPPVDECPDGVFIEDAVVVFRNVALLTRSALDSRQSEVAGAAAAVEELGCSINRIRSPGTLDGGDVLKVGDTIYVGSGGRTNADGLRQLRSIFGPLGADIIAVPGPVHKALHLKSAVTALPDGRIIGYPPLVEHPDFFPHFVPVPEESGAHIVDLDGNKILMAADCPRSTDLFAGMGYDPITVDIGEFQKLEGFVTSLSVRLRQLWEDRS